MKRKFKKILSVFLCMVMVFTAFSTAFASGEQDEKPVWCDIRPIPGTTQVVLSKGDSHDLFVAYNPGDYENVSLEWSSQGDSCQIELSEPEEKSGLIQRATVTSVSCGNFGVTVKLVADDGTVLDEDTLTVISKASEFGKWLGILKEELKLTFYFFGLLPAFGVPMGIIAKAMEIFGMDEDVITQFVDDYTLWMGDILNPNEVI